MIIGLVGRTNVGKSTLFNRLVGNYRAIVTDVAGTTRELLREKTTLFGKEITLVDSPGLEDFQQEQHFIQEIIDEADLLLFIVDGKEEAGEYDYMIRDMILQSAKKDKTLLVVNKLDGHVYGKKTDMLLAERYALGIADLLPLSAKEQEGLGEIVDGLSFLARKHKDAIESRPPSIQQGDDKGIHLAIVGRPNVGKSTLLNTLVGEELARVQDTPGTTLDYICADFRYKNTAIKLYDTAGIRKKGKTVGLEKIAYAKTLKMIERVRPVVVVMVDMDEGLAHRDKSLIGEMMEKGIGLVIAVNKIDLYEPHIADKNIEQISHRIPGGERIPIVKISAKDGLGLPKLMDKVIQVSNAYHNRVSTGTLNTVLSKAWSSSPPRFPKNKICKWKYITQVDVAPPKFVLSVNNKDYANFSFKRWVERVIRKEYNFVGVPIILKFTSKVDKNPYLKVNKEQGLVSGKREDED